MRIAPLSAVVLLLALPNAARTQAQDPSLALRRMVNSYQSAWNAHDAVALVAFYTDDADQVMEDAPTIVGRPALEQWWQAQFAGMDPGLKLTLTITGVRWVTPQVAVINTIGTSGGRDAQGKALPADTDRGTWVVVEKGGRWLMAALRVYPAERTPAR